MEDRQDNFFQRAKEAVVGLVGNILENPKEELSAGCVTRFLVLS